MNKPEEKKVDQPVVEERKQPGVDIAALTSRWDYGAEGSRVGLLLQMKERIEEAKADFLVVVGGMVNQRAVLNTLKKIIENERERYVELKAEFQVLQKEYQALAAQLKQSPQNQELSLKVRKIIRQIVKKEKEVLNAKPRSSKQLVADQIELLANSVNQDLPKLFRSDGKRMKIYVVTSLAYDGEIGRKVVKRLLELRRSEDDIRYLSSRRPEDTTFRVPLQKSGKTFAVVVPNKGVWRSLYYSTYPDRLIQDEMQRTSQKPCDVYAVGCFASSINRRDGELPYQRISIPALHKLEDVVTAENMIGVRIVRFMPNEQVQPVLTISFKDFVSEERKYIASPSDCSKTEFSIVEEVKKSGEVSIGMLEDELGVTRFKLLRALTTLVKRKRAKVGLVYDEDSQKYGFASEWFQRMIRYTWPDKAAWTKDVLAGFGCLHGGSVHTAYKFFVQQLPGLLVAHEVKYLLAVGDLTEGLKHNLALRGEVYGGMNNTWQEKATAYMMAEVLLEVLNVRLEKALKEKDVKKMSAQEMTALVSDSLMTFLYWIGNHDDWSSDFGYDPLAMFDATLKEELGSGLEKIKNKYGLSQISVPEVLKHKVILMQKGKPYTMPSGVTIDGAHYYAGRTQTSSTWLQRALSQLKAQLVWVANFHVAEIVEKWEAHSGLRVAMQLPTLKSKSSFEENKGKTTDFGVGLLKVWSHKGRVMVSETNFLGVNPRESLSNKDIVRGLLRDAGVGKWVDLKEIQ
ncbi:MAG: hypothetical protein A3H63_00685 [Candidatus Harrisonbacteria bacterium RIFCSPLOWO2_02_FULL_45_10c]|uniref:Uncharacterized protein n=1 Tax=Candidatus Harrisonbacteria bacterium RIFCSPLOWO2_02_FULL_45_10c TaxID=1798410 RepID=A0A1G1ZTT0_9BACT|nr:MAG: hypothetical protein A3H63_00685 [Candidatus Harrisonbacteria bacterium RIFCSPLOWO2_02_FULL_45_10c]